MPKYNYLVVDAGGLERAGEASASDIKSVAGRLRRQGLFIVNLTEAQQEEEGTVDQTSNAQQKDNIAKKISLRGLFGLLWPVRDGDRILFLRQGALMLRSGLALTQCLEEAARTTPKPRFSAALSRMRQGIQSGSPLSQEMAKEKNLFPKIVVKMIEGAEASGEMDVVFDRMADHLEQWASIRSAFITSLSYPLIVVLVSITVMGFLVIKVIPSFSQFFASRQTALPASTQLLVDISSWTARNGIFLLAGILIGLVTWGVGYAFAPTRRIIDRGILSLPVVGNLVKIGAMAHLCRTLSMLIGSGVTLLESLRIVQGLIGNRALTHCIDQAATSILAGGDLAGGLRHSAIPPMVPQVVSVGEKTGNLAHVLEEMGRFYERQLHEITRRLSALMEPVLILIVGGMVGFVYFAFFQAIFQIATAGRR